MSRTRAELELLVQLKDEASRGMDKIAKKGGFLRDAFAFATGGLITSGISKITGAVGDMFGTMFGESMEAQQGMAQLESVIKSTGGSAGLTAKEVMDLSTSLSAEGGLSRATDDAVLAASNMLLTFTNIKRDVFPETTQAVLDMATAMNNGAAPSLEDLQAKSILVGKALNDPVKGLTALTRVGVSFTAEQKNMIKELVASGDVMGAQKIILAELGKEFGGSALASTKTFGGQMDILKGQFEGAMQGIGDKLMPKVQEFLDFLNSPDGQAVINTFIDIIGGGISGAIDLAVGAFNLAAPIVKGFIDGLKTGDMTTFKDALKGLPEPLQAVIGFLGDAAGNVKKFFDAVATGDPAAVKKFWQDLGGPIGFVGEKLTDVVTGVGNFFAGMNGQGSKEANQFWTDFNEGVDLAKTKGTEFWNTVLNIQAGETPFEATMRTAGAGAQVLGTRVSEVQTEGRALWDQVLGAHPGQSPFETMVAGAASGLDTFKTRVQESKTEGLKFWTELLNVPPGETPFDTVTKNGTANVEAFRIRLGLTQTEGTNFWKTVIEVKEGETPFEAAMNRANEGLITLANTVSKWGGDMIENFKKGVSAVWNKITTIGADIIAGVKTGIGNAWNSFTTWVQDKFGGLVGGIMAAIKGGSPAMLYAPVGTSLVQGVRKGIVDEWQQFQPEVEGWFESFKLSLKLKAALDNTKDIGRTLMDTVKAGASDECPQVSQQLSDCVDAAVAQATVAAGVPAAKTPGQMVAWAIRDGIIDEQDQVYAAFETFWDGLWGIASERAAQIQQLINNTTNSGSASSAGTGATGGGGAGGGGGGGGQVMDRGGIVTSPTPALLAANHRPEAVIPLDGARGLGNTFNVVINAGPGVNGAALADDFVDQVILRIGERTVNASTYRGGF